MENHLAPTYITLLIITYWLCKEILTSPHSLLPQGELGNPNSVVGRLSAAQGTVCWQKECLQEDV